MNGVTVFACARANLGKVELPELAKLIEVPCTGRVTVALLLAGLARGRDGALVLGRHQETCRLNGSEDGAANRTARAGRLAEVVGLDRRRLRFAVPEPGLAGPLRAVEDFVASIADLGGSPLSPSQSSDSPRADREGLDTSFALLAWLSRQPGLVANGASWCDQHDLPVPVPGGPVLYAGVAPHLDILADSLWLPIRFPDVVRAALAVLARVGVEQVGVGLGGCGVVGSEDASRWREASTVFALCDEDRRQLAEAGVEATLLDDLLLRHGPELSRLPTGTRVACDGSLRNQTALLERLGVTPVDVGPDPLPRSFSLGPTHRVAADERLCGAEEQGALAMLVGGPSSLARWSLVTRHGTWRTSRVTPLLAHQLVPGEVPAS